MKILLLSDTHGDTQRFSAVIQKVQPDMVIHAGDFCIDEQFMKQHCTYYVAGNNDWTGPRIVDFQLGELKCRLMHGDQFHTSIFAVQKRNEEMHAYAKANQIDVLFNGHSHIESVYYADNILVINPGSLSLPRNEKGLKSYAVLEFVNNQFVDLNPVNIFHYY